MSGQFLTDEEKIKYYSARSNVSTQNYKHQKTLKVYEGAELMLYHYDQEGALIIDTVLVVTDINMNSQGIKTAVIDRKEFRINRIGDIPNKIYPFDILTHMPPRCFIERTIKKTRNNKYIQGLATGVYFKSKSDPTQKIPEHVQVIPLLKARDHFAPEELDLAFARLEAGQ